MPGPRDKKVDIDYAELHRTGRKVVKSRQVSMASPDLTIDSINISSDIEDFLESYEVNDLSSEIELREYVTRIGDLKKEFRRVYAKIKLVEKEHFNSHFPNYETELALLQEKFKIGSEKLKLLRQDEESQLGLNEKVQAKSQWQLSVEQINWDLSECDWSQLHDIDDIKRKIDNYDSKLEKVCLLYGNLQGVYKGGM